MTAAGHEAEAARLLSRCLEAASHGLELSQCEEDAKAIIHHAVVAAQERLLDRFEQQGITLRKPADSERGIDAKRAAL